MPHATEFMRAKLALGALALVIGVPALAFALFGWVQSSILPFGEALRYVCVLGSLGAVMVGGLQLNESFLVRKSVAKPVKQSALDFLVTMEYDDEPKLTAI